MIPGEQVTDRNTGNDIPDPNGLHAFDSGEVPIRNYWRILVHRRSVFFFVFSLVALIGAIRTFTTTAEYRATLTLEIQRHGPDILTHKDVLSVDQSFAAYQDFYQTQYKIMQSRKVLGIATKKIDLINRPEFVNRRPTPISRMVASVSRTLARLGGTDSESPADVTDPLDAAIAYFSGRVAVQPVRNSYLVQVSFLDSSPELARDAANAISAAYQQFSLESRHTATAEASVFLRDQVAQLQTEIAEKERQLQDDSSQREILALRDETKSISSQALADLHEEYIASKSRLALAQAQHESVIDAPPEALPQVVENSLISSLKREYANLEREHSQMLERFHPDWPPLRQLEQELNQARERLSLETESIAFHVRSAARTDYERVQGEEYRLREQVEEQKLEVQRVNLDAIEIASLQAEIETERGFLDALVNRQSETVVSKRLSETQASNIRVVDPAELPVAPEKPNKILNLIASILAGLIVGIASAYTVDHLDNTVESEQDVQRITGLPVFAQIPQILPLGVIRNEGVSRADPTGNDRRGLASHDDPRSLVGEAFKNLRTSIQLASPDHPPRSIVVTSSEPGDGKSTVSMNLAVVLSQMGRRVLLIDGDLRRPTLGHTFGAKDSAGLSNVLTGNADLGDVVRDTVVPGLSFLPSGPVPPNPSELLESTSMRVMLEQFQESKEYEHVILDSPPIVQVPDSVILATRTDAAIVVVRAGKTSRESLSAGAGRLKQSRARVTGVVLNAVPERAGGYYRAYYKHDQDSSNPSKRSLPRVILRLGKGRRSA